MSGKTLGFVLEETSFYVHTSNATDVALFGNDDISSRLRLYSAGDSNSGFYIETTKPSFSNTPSLSIQGAHLAYPSFHVQADTGWVGINTSAPRSPIDIVGNVFLDGQLQQNVANAMIASDIVESTTIVTNNVTTCNMCNVINFTSTQLSHVGGLRIEDSGFGCNVEPLLTVTSGGAGLRDLASFRSESLPTPSFKILNNGNVGVALDVPLEPLHVFGNVRIDSGSIINVVGGVQRVQTAAGNTLVASPGRCCSSFDLRWDHECLDEGCMIEVTCVLFGSGSNKKRLHHRVHMMVSPVNDGVSKPAIDCIAEQSCMSSHAFTQRPRMTSERISATSVRVFNCWECSEGGYHVSLKLDVVGPASLGQLTVEGVTAAAQ